MKAEHLRLRPVVFVVFAIASTIYMLVYLERFAMTVSRFALTLIAISSVVLAVEVSLLRFLRKREVGLLTRTRWARDYAFVSALGSLLLIALVGIVGLAQDRDLYVWLIVITTNVMNIWLIAFAADKVASYRESAARAKRELMPRLQIVRSMNDRLTSANDVAENRDLAAIHASIWKPLVSFEQRARTQTDDECAQEIEAFIGGVLRPLSHDLHPITPEVGLIPAISDLGCRVTSDPVVREMDTANALLDDDVRREAFRWVAHASASTPQSAHVQLMLDERSLRIDVTGATSALLDPLQEAAGIVLESFSQVRVPLRGQVTHELLSDADSHAPKRVERGFLFREWRWEQQKSGFSVLLVTLLALVSVPAGTFIANKNVTPAAAAAAVTWMVVPPLFAWVFTKVVLNVSGIRALLWFVGSWISLGVVTGLASGLTFLFFDPTGGMTVVVQEIARATLRLTLIGGLVSLTAELAGNAHRALATINGELHQALVRREAILEHARARSQLIAEVLHRRIQGRLSAIAVLFRMHQRERAACELTVITGTVLPDLMTSLRKGSESSRLPSIEAPPGLEVILHGHEKCAGLEPRVETIACRVIEEAAANSYRHGQATCMEVLVHPEDDFLLITCRDNGRGLASDFQPGLGSRLFDEATDGTGHWRMSSSATGTTIDFAIPLSEDAPAPAYAGSPVRSPVLNR